MTPWYGGYGGGWSIEDEWYLKGKSPDIFGSKVEEDLVYAGLMRLYGLETFAVSELARIATLITEEHESRGEKIEGSTESRKEDEDG